MKEMQHFTPLLILSTSSLTVWGYKLDTSSKVSMLSAERLFSSRSPENMVSYGVFFYRTARYSTENQGPHVDQS